MTLRRFAYDASEAPGLDYSPTGDFVRWSDIAPLLRLARAALSPDRANHEISQACQHLDAALKEQS